jgi:hypothetical protein
LRQEPRHCSADAAGAAAVCVNYAVHADAAEAVVAEIAGPALLGRAVNLKQQT